MGAERVRRKEEHFQATLEKDLTDGINLEVRTKETKLRALAEQLRSGFSLKEATQVMGEPDAVQVN